MEGEIPRKLYPTGGSISQEFLHPGRISEYFQGEGFCGTLGQLLKSQNMASRVFGSSGGSVRRALRVITCWFKLCNATLCPEVKHLLHCLS